jgi:DNA gyrase subunit A
MAVTDLRVMGRATQGVRLIKLNDDDQIASIAKIEDVKEDELAIELDENGNPIITETDIETTSSDESEDADNKDDNTTNIEE